jgi:REP element-mobilizing transposase RayT
VCCITDMSHPYPPHDPRLPYSGKRHYSLTFCTDQRRRVFLGDEAVSLVRTQILRAACETDFDIPAYCFMPDHVHVITRGCDDTSDAKAFTKLAKQYSSYYFQRQHRFRLWQRYGFERVIRDASSSLSR